MRFNFTLISAFFFASAVLADRSLEHRSESSQLNIAEKRTNAATSRDSGEVIYANWAGAVLNESVPTFSAISGTFTVPQISGPAGSGVGIWVGIDIGSQCGAIFQAGVVYQMYDPSFGQSYKAVAQWLPDIEPSEFTDIKVSPGDLITVTVMVASDQTTGNATIENFEHGTNQMTSQTLKFSNKRHALCQLSAEWIISKVGVSTLANFSTVSFRKPLALGGDQNFTPAGSEIFEIENETAVYADKGVVAIWYYELQAGDY